ncbi:hypothetical protein [Singulisphaera acidiphila]|uniref:Uncharacterized protein n=1 Tax=Singulisphaera acidiphila (strain ATCC BAA-1392 / DSM 18658 / VKM B-2454 / MOB10) TaxID=886293 RepID=L0DJY4_SINAD|nr:hypothetical protein [Singulisphaera acidiphila]AGA29155.1 hypothetical protein Sinac_5000 [Singulisphaera acidiphila DSM 18658]
MELSGEAAFGTGQDNDRRRLDDFIADYRKSPNAGDEMGTVIEITTSPMDKAMIRDHEM